VNDGQAQIRVGKIVQINSITPHYYYIYNSLGRTCDTIEELLQLVQDDLKLPDSEIR